MSKKNFDPYHVWLGIPPKDQPPNLYRLLGLELYESDAQVIDAAANRQTSYLQEMAAGPNRRQSQELLNEIAAARRRLLDENRKKKYDEKLKAELAELSKSSTETDSASSETGESESDTDTGTDSSSSDSKKSAEPDAKKPKPASVAGSVKKKDAVVNAKLQVILGSCGLLLLSIVAWTVIGGGDDETSADSTGGTQGTGEHSAVDTTGTGPEGGSDTSVPDPFDEHLLAHWAFDDESLDLASVSDPNAMAATLHGAPKIQGDGPIGSYLQLDGKKDWLQIPPTAVNLKTGSIAGWFRIQDPPDRKSSLLLRIRLGEQRLDIRRNQDGGLRIANPAQEWSLTATQQIPLGKWFHFAISWTDSAPAAVFLNGSPSGVSETPLTLPVCSGVSLGTGSAPPTPASRKKKAGPNRLFHRLSIDDLRFYGQPIDPESVQKLAAASIITPSALKPYEVVKPPTLTIGADGLVAQYLFEDAAKPEVDKSGNATGTSHGAKVVDDDTFGKILDLNGSSYVEVPRIVDSDFTITFWMKALPDQAAVAEDIGLVDASVPGDAADFRAALSKGLVTFEVGDPDGKAKKQIQSRTAVADGAWHFIALSRSGASGKLWLFVDGELHGAADGPKGPRGDSPALRIGRIQNDSRYFKGQLAALRIHQQVLPRDTMNKLGGQPLASMLEARRKAHAAAMAAKVGELRNTAAGRNQILCEIWKNLPGKPVKPVQDKARSKATPDEIRFLARLAADMSESRGDNYGQKLSGYLLPPKSGSYAFEAVFDDSGEFLLSTSGHPKDLSPVKEARALKAGQAYYFEVFHKEESGNDSFAVNWTIPGEKKAVITGSHLTSIPGYHRFSSTVPVSATTGSDAITLKINPDKSILASGENRDGVYTVDLNWSVPELTCLRLDTLPDESLNGDGPGMGALGMFAVQEVELAVVEGNQVSKVPLAEPASRDGVPKSAADGDEDSAWSVRRRSGESAQPVSLFLTPVSPVRLNRGARLRITIRQSTNIGRFRISATAMDTASLAGEIARATAPVARVEKKKLKLLVNLNGATITDPKEKEQWVTARPFRGNASWGFKGGKGIGNANEKSSPLPNAIEGIQSFHARVEDGSYMVTLYFADHWANKPGDRQFTVQIEKPPVYPVDLIAKVGKGQPSRLAKVVRVNDGTLDIVFQKVKGEPILNAIRIEQR